MRAPEETTGVGNKTHPQKPRMAHPHALTNSEEIELLRSGEVVSSFAGAFGRSLRETRLTAMLGYLIALSPEPFCQQFGFRGRPLSVNLETRRESDRSDILIKTTVGTGIVEAKVTATDPFQQSRKYRADWRVLLTEHRASSKEKRRRGVTYLRWRDLEQTLTQLQRTTDSRVRFVSKDLLRHLGEHAMVSTKQSAEIYAREINTEDTLALFLNAQIYGCHFERSSRVSEALYFAPHFGQHIAAKHPGVRVGISYVARIKEVQVVESWQDFLDVVRGVRGKPWLASHMKLLEPLRLDWKWSEKRHSILFLSTPRLVFNPPVLKAELQKGKGRLGKRVFSFDELFAAWGC